MPTGPKGHKRPADVIGNAARVMRIATGEEADTVVDDSKDPAAKALEAEGGMKAHCTAVGEPFHETIDDGA